MKPILIKFEQKYPLLNPDINPIEELTEITNVDKVRLLKEGLFKSPTTRITKVNAETIDDD